MGKGSGFFGELLGVAAAAAVGSAAAKAEYNNRLKNAAMRIKLDIATADDYELVCTEMRKALQSTVKNCYRRIEQLNSEGEKIISSADGSKTICKIADDFKNDVSLDEFLIKDSDGNILLKLIKIDDNGTEIIKAYTDTDEEYDLDGDYRRYEKARTRLIAISDELVSLKEELKEALSGLSELEQLGY